MGVEIVIATGDGERLAGTLYLPDGGGPFAALLEALPYRKDDVTESNRSTYERYREHGYAVLRLDLRGTGSSTGISTDEYDDDERADLRAVIEWLAGQSWSSGRVGMFGTSYSGFNSLQMAADGVPALGAVVATYATDDRYTDDVHYAGGVLRAIDLIDYPLYMVAMNALPPVPAVFGDGWRDEWRRRLDETPPWLITWLEHPLDGPSWRRGSIRLGPDGVGYERMACPTMIVAGWADGYRNNTFRVVEQYERNGLPWRLLAGPWVHQSPERARPGPNVDDDIAVLAFFDEHLRDIPPQVHPPGQVYVRRPVRPQPDLAFHPGRWVDIDRWPPAGRRTVTLRSERTSIDALAVRGDVGVAAWNSCGGALPWGQPLDQRDDNARSIVHDWAVADVVGLSGAEVLGNVGVAFRVRSDQPYGHVSVKLCDVLPDGTSTLVTRTMLDLAHVGCWPADPHGVVGAVPTPPTQGQWIDVDLEFEATTWTLEPGHVLRVAIAGTDWPNCWPPPGPVTLHVDAASMVLTLPIVDGLPTSTHPVVAAGTGAADHDDRAHDDQAHDDHDHAGVTWRVEHDVLGRETRVVTGYGGTYQGAHDAEITDDYRGELGVSTTDPGEAWARGSSSFTVEWPGATVRTESRLHVVSHGDSLDVEIELVAFEGDMEVARRRWTSSPRP